jgi:hypothetical protein
MCGFCSLVVEKYIDVICSLFCPYEEKKLLSKEKPWADYFFIHGFVQRL